ncbi:MAG: tetratricopeptide repeat protein, partial [bacterium]|nr:tetratricopeptide repeat protein [bacterium]
MKLRDSRRQFSGRLFCRGGLFSAIVLGVVLSLLLFGPLWTQSGAQEQTDPKELEAQLAAATGRVRLDLLLELTEAYREADPAKAITFGSEALELLAATPDEDRELALLNALAGAHLAQQGRGPVPLLDYETGLRYAAQAEQLARTAGNKPALARSLVLIGRISWRTEELERALQELTEAIGLLEELGDTAGVASASNSAGIVALERGDTQQALAFYLRAFRLYEGAGDLHGVGQVLNSIGMVYQALGQHDEALDFLYRSLEIKQQLGDQQGVGRRLHNIGNTYRATGDPAQALEAHLRALEIREQVGVPRSIARTLLAIGVDYRDLGELEQATAYVQRSIGMWEEIGNKQGLAAALHYMGELHRQAGSYEAARKAFERALALNTEAGKPPSSTLRELVEVYGALGQGREMLEAFRQYDAITKESYDEENSRSIAEMQARFDADQKEKEIELLRQQQALQALELERQRGTRRALVGGFGLVLLI